MTGSIFLSAAPVVGVKVKPTSMSMNVANALFVVGMLTIPLEFTQIGIAQPAQLWMLLVLPFVILNKNVQLSTVEITTFLLFIAYAISLTLLCDYPRIKSADQIFKFAILYPGFYYVGRTFGATYARNAPPIGYLFLIGLFLFEMIAQYLPIPYLYQEVDFAQGVLHGTFKERNWISMYFFMFSYFLFEFCSARKAKDAAAFLALNAVVTALTQSKTIIVACGIVVLLRSRLPLIVKLAMIGVGACLYLQFFANDLSDDMIRVRIEQERGLAYDQSLIMISRNIFGYGFGFVEGYFGNLALVIQGLGAGTNSVFSVPLDLMIIAGVVGLAAWLVFFCGIGLGATTILGPIAALSLLNPLHQSDLVYFFIGMLISGNFIKRLDGGPTRGRNTIVGLVVKIDE